jgi:ElaB/YqjD/DUF883 family membrane-anchored ribosome-binding protein
MADEILNPVINPEVNLGDISNTPPETENNLRGNLESARSQVQSAAGDLRAAAEAKARELRSTAENKANELRDRAQHAYGDARERVESAYGEARERARTLQEDGEQYVRENPTRAVLTALGAGFVLGLIFRR